MQLEVKWQLPKHLLVFPITTKLTRIIACIAKIYGRDATTLTYQRLGSLTRSIQHHNPNRNHLSYAKSQRLSVLQCPFCGNTPNKRDPGLKVGNKLSRFLVQDSSKNKSTQTMFISFLHMQKSPELTSKHLPGSVTMYCRTEYYLKNFQLARS